MANEHDNDEPQILQEKAPPITETSSSTSRDSDSGTSIKRPSDIEPQGNIKKPAIISNRAYVLPQNDRPQIDENRMKECEECHGEFLRSYLYRNFFVNICDHCRQPKEAHELITRTDAKTKYLLKDCDLDLREPPLRYMLKKNPYQCRGDMRLYLKFQVEERAIEVHGSEEQLETELEKREEKRQTQKQKVYDNKMKSLSMQVRSSLFKKKTTNEHKHEFGEAKCINEDDDIYERICKTCGFKWEYEEM